MFRQFYKLLCTHLGKILIFYNMLLVAKYAPRKNLEKMHTRQNGAKKRPNFVRKRPNLVYTGLFIVMYYFLRKSIISFYIDTFLCVVQIPNLNFPIMRSDVPVLQVMFIMSCLSINLIVFSHFV